MKRAQLIEKLMSEGFSEKTLVNFNDKQLEKFANKVLKEAQTVTTTKTVYDSKKPEDVADLNTALKDPNVNKNNIEVKEDEVISVGKLRKSKKVKPVFKNLHEFVENTINSNYHSLVTKGDMVSLVKEKINESSDLYEKEMIDHLPEFMNEFDMAQPDIKPDVKPAPSKPDTDRPTREKPRHPGQRPQDPKKQPLPNPVPKAKAKEISGEEAKFRVINMINKIFSNN
jgi:hypothetical protein